MDVSFSATEDEQQEEVDKQIDQELTVVDETTLEDQDQDERHKVEMTIKTKPVKVDVVEMVIEKPMKESTEFEVVIQQPETEISEVVIEKEIPEVDSKETLEVEIQKPEEETVVTEYEIQQPKKEGVHEDKMPKTEESLIEIPVDLKTKPEEIIQIKTDVIKTETVVKEVVDEQPQAFEVTADKQLQETGDIKVELERPTPVDITEVTTITNEKIDVQEEVPKQDISVTSIEIVPMKKEPIEEETPAPVIQTETIVRKTIEVGQESDKPLTETHREGIDIIPAVDDSKEMIAITEKDLKQTTEISTEEGKLDKMVVEINLEKPTTVEGENVEIQGRPKEEVSVTSIDVIPKKLEHVEVEVQAPVIETETIVRKTIEIDQITKEEISDLESHEESLEIEPTVDEVKETTYVTEKDIPVQPEEISQTVEVFETETVFETRIDEQVTEDDSLKHDVTELIIDSGLYPELEASAPLEETVIAEREVIEVIEDTFEETETEAPVKEIVMLQREQLITKEMPMEAESAEMQKDTEEVILSQVIETSISGMEVSPDQGLIAETEIEKPVEETVEVIRETIETDQAKPSEVSIVPIDTEVSEMHVIIESDDVHEVPVLLPEVLDIVVRPQETTGVAEEQEFQVEETISVEINNEIQAPTEETVEETRETIIVHSPEPSEVESDISEITVKEVEVIPVDVEIDKQVDEEIETTRETIEITKEIPTMTEESAEKDVEEKEVPIHELETNVPHEETVEEVRDTIQVLKEETTYTELRESVSEDLTGLSEVELKETTSVVVTETKELTIPVDQILTCTSEEQKEIVSSQIDEFLPVDKVVSETSLEESLEYSAPEHLEEATVEICDTKTEPTSTEDMEEKVTEIIQDSDKVKSSEEIISEKIPIMQAEIPAETKDEKITIETEKTIELKEEKEVSLTVEEIVILPDSVITEDQIPYRAPVDENEDEDQDTSDIVEQEVSQSTEDVVKDVPETFIKVIDTSEVDISTPKPTEETITQPSAQVDLFAEEITKDILVSITTLTDKPSEVTEYELHVQQDQLDDESLEADIPEPFVDKLRKSTSIEEDKPTLIETNVAEPKENQLSEISAEIIQQFAEEITKDILDKASKGELIPSSIEEEETEIQGEISEEKEEDALVAAVEEIEKKPYVQEVTFEVTPEQVTESLPNETDEKPKEEEGIAEVSELQAEKETESVSLEVDVKEKEVTEKVSFDIPASETQISEVKFEIPTKLDMEKKITIEETIELPEEVAEIEIQSQPDIPVDETPKSTTMDISLEKQPQEISIAAIELKPQEQVDITVKSETTKVIEEQVPIDKEVTEKTNITETISKDISKEPEKVTVDIRLTEKPVVEEIKETVTGIIEETDVQRDVEVRGKTISTETISEDISVPEEPQKVAVGLIISEKPQVEEIKETIAKIVEEIDVPVDVEMLEKTVSSESVLEDSAVSEKSVTVTMDVTVAGKPQEITETVTEVVEVVQTGPRFIRTLSDLTVHESEVGEFIVEFESEIEVEITWFIDNEPVQESENFIVTIEKDFSKLVIPEVFIEDEGEYKVVITNTVGTIESVCFLTVIGKLNNYYLSQTYKFIEVLKDFH